MTDQLNADRVKELANQIAHLMYDHMHGFAKNEMKIDSVMISEELNAIGAVTASLITSLKEPLKTLEWYKMNLDRSVQHKLEELKSGIMEDEGVQK